MIVSPTASKPPRAVRSDIVPCGNRAGASHRPQPDVRQRALTYADGESRHYFAQVQSYQSMPDDELLKIPKDPIRLFEYTC